MPLFFFGGSATPIASKPVQRTDLVDASESRWGGKKNVVYYILLHLPAVPV